MAASKVARKRQGSLPKEPPPIINGQECKEYALDNFEIIKTIGECKECGAVTLLSVMHLLKISVLLKHLQPTERAYIT